MYDTYHKHTQRRARAWCESNENPWHIKTITWVCLEMAKFDYNICRAVCYCWLFWSSAFYVLLKLFFSVCVCLFCFFLLVSANKFVGLSMFFAFRFIKIHRIIINFESTNNRTHTNSYLWAFSAYTLKKNVATVRKAYIHIKSLDLNLDRPNEQTKKKNTKETETQRLTTIRENCT